MCKSRTKFITSILQMKKKREAAGANKRIKRVRFASAAAFLAVVAGAIFILPGLIGHQNKPIRTDSTVAQSQTTQSTASDIGPSASMMAILSIDGIRYSPVIVDRQRLFTDNEPDTMTITAGREIGIVELQIDERGNADVSSVRIFSSIVPKGETVYEWAGYSPEFRVCARDNSGAWRGFERNGFEESLATNRPVSELFDFRGKVVEILISNNYPSEIGRITDRNVIEGLMQELTEQAYFTGNDMGSRIYVDDKLYRLYLRLSDNSITELVVNPESEYGAWIETIMLPAGFVDEISKHVIGSFSMESSNYGNLYAEVDYFLPIDVKGMEIFDDYCMESVWVDGSTGNLYMGSWSKWQWLIADDAKGDIRIEGQDIYYLTVEGSIAHVKFEYSGDQASLYEMVESGADLSQYVTVRETLYSGSFMRLQVRLGDLWALDLDGNLSCKGELVAKGVKTFALDAMGVTYSDGQAIWRRLYHGDTVKLIDTDTVAIAAASVNIYYSPAEGGIWRIRVDGSENQKISDLAAAKMVVREGTMAILERDTGKVYLLYKDRYIFDTIHRADDIDLSLYQRLYYIEGEPGNLESMWYSIESDGSKYKLYLD